MGIQERKNRQKQLLRQEILDAAREMFVQDGYEGVSMRKIAQKIEYSPTTIYHYFNDKAELLRHILCETFERLNKQLDVTLGAPRANSLQCLQAGMKEYVAFALKYRSHYYVTFMLIGAKESPSEQSPNVHAIGMTAFDYLRQAVKRAMEDGFLAKADLELTSQTAWVGIHGVSALLLNMGCEFPFVDHQRLIDHTIRTILIGLGADTAALEISAEEPATP